MLNFNFRHLGLTKALAPCSRGFHKNFTFLPGSGNHHGYEPQLDDDDPLIHSMCTDGHWMEGDKVLDRKTELPPNFYSTVSFTDKMLGMLDGRTEEEKQKPFFAYLAYTAPHWPLQAPPEKIKKYGESPVTTSLTSLDLTSPTTQSREVR